jgi:hypothetical protein
LDDSLFNICESFLARAVFCSMKRLVDMVLVDVVGVDEWDDVVRV